MRYGIFGGTFDPIHNGHLILARDALEQLELDKMIFIPAALSPHKLTERPYATNQERLKMLQLAIQGEPRFVIDERELYREGPSYTFDTIYELKAEIADPNVSLSYLVGQDHLPKLSTWYRWEELKTMMEFVVCLRTPSVQVASASDPLFLKRQLDALGIHSFLTRQIDISATEIRMRLSNGQSIQYFVPERVQQWIEENHLYSNTNPQSLKL